MQLQRDYVGRRLHRLSRSFRGAPAAYVCLMPAETDSELGRALRAAAARGLMHLPNVRIRGPAPDWHQQNGHATQQPPELHSLEQLQQALQLARHNPARELGEPSVGQLEQQAQTVGQWYSSLAGTCCLLVDLSKAAEEALTTVLPDRYYDIVAHLAWVHGQLEAMALQAWQLTVLDQLPTVSRPDDSKGDGISVASVSYVACASLQILCCSQLLDQLVAAMDTVLQLAGECACCADHPLLQAYLGGPGAPWDTDRNTRWRAAAPYLALRCVDAGLLYSSAVAVADAFDHDPLACCKLHLAAANGWLSDVLLAAADAAQPLAARATSNIQPPELDTVLPGVGRWAANDNPSPTWAAFTLVRSMGRGVRLLERLLVGRAEFARLAVEQGLGERMDQELEAAAAVRSMATTAILQLPGAADLAQLDATARADAQAEQLRWESVRDWADLLLNATQQQVLLDDVDLVLLQYQHLPQQQRDLLSRLQNYGFIEPCPSGALLLAQLLQQRLVMALLRLGRQGRAVWDNTLQLRLWLGEAGWDRFCAVSVPCTLLLPAAPPCVEGDAEEVAQQLQASLARLQATTPPTRTTAAAVHIQPTDHVLPAAPQPLWLDEPDARSRWLCYEVGREQRAAQQRREEAELQAAPPHYRSSGEPWLQLWERAGTAEYFNHLQRFSRLVWQLHTFKQAARWVRAHSHLPPLEAVRDEMEG